MRQRAHRRLPNMSEGGFRIKVRGKGCVIYGNERVRGIEPPCAAWEAAVLPLNYTRDVISDCRFSIADCNRNKRTPADRAVACPHAIRECHCQEITSSEALPAFLSAAGPGTLPD